MINIVDPYSSYVITFLFLGYTCSCLALYEKGHEITLFVNWGYINIMTVMPDYQCHCAVMNFCSAAALPALCFTCRHVEG